VDTDKIEDDIDREDDREDACTTPDLASACQKLKIDLDQEIESQKYSRIDQDLTRKHKLCSEEDDRHSNTHLEHDRRYPDSDNRKIQRKLAKELSHGVNIASALELRYHRK
jgi:hypothetical protein